MAEMIVNTVVWGTYPGDTTNLIVGFTVDLVAYSLWTITAAGGPPPNFQTAAAVVGGMISADGIVIDNLLNDTALLVQQGDYVETVPAYQKTVMKLPGDMPIVQIAGSGTPKVYFFKGSFQGSEYVTNNLAVQKDANVANVGDGTLDIFGKTVRAVSNYNLATGTDLNTVSTGGWFDVLNPVNGPGAGWYHLEVQVFSSSNTWVMQTATNLTTPTPTQWRRMNVSGSWGTWVRCDGGDRQIAGSYQAAGQYVRSTTGNQMYFSWDGTLGPVAQVDATWLGKVWTDWGMWWSQTARGWHRFPNNFMIQWGLDTNATLSDYHITLPVGFPGYFASVVATPEIDAASNVMWGLSQQIANNSQFIVRTRRAVNGGALANQPGLPVRWIACGW